MECGGAHSLYWRDSLSVGAAACSALDCACWEVYYQTSNYPTKEPKQQTTQPCAWVVYIAGDTLRHQPMGVDHMTVLQFHGPITFCVLQWCHPMLARTQRRTSCSARMITLYGDLNGIQAHAQQLLLNQQHHYKIHHFRCTVLHCVTFP